MMTGIIIIILTIVILVLLLNLHDMKSRMELLDHSMENMINENKKTEYLLNKINGSYNRLWDEHQELQLAIARNSKLQVHYTNCRICGEEATIIQGEQNAS